jgi:aminoglycoside phosphotransferase (APT) family kinase protein
MSVSYSTIKAASKIDAITELLATRVIGPALPSVRIKEVKTTLGRRLEAPRALWNVYKAQLETAEGSEVSVLFWTKAFFNDKDCQEYRRWVEPLLTSRNGNPLDPAGHARFFEDLNLFMFFFPTDPVFPGLGTVFNAEAIRPLLADHFSRLAGGGSVGPLTAERVKYLPEIACIARYQADLGKEEPGTIYGKVQHSRRGALTYDVMKALWDLPARASGELVVAEPLAYHQRLALLLQSALPGEEVKGDRHSDLFKALCEAAGRTLGYVHSSGISVGQPHSAEVEIGRLMNRLDEFKLSSPSIYFMLRDLLRQIAAKAERIPPEAPVPSHGDYKYNQFLFDGERFGLIDVEFFVQAEPSFDLGKFCGHLAPSVPKDWSDTVEGYEARRIFLDAYCAVRPEYKGARFCVYEALSLATRALVTTWSQGSDWEYMAKTLLALAYDRLKTRWGE